MSSHLLAGLFSFLTLYSLTILLVVYVPEDVAHAADPRDNDGEHWGAPRVESAVIANSSIVSVASLLLLTRLFGVLGDALVDTVIMFVECNEHAAAEPPVGSSLGGDGYSRVGTTDTGEFQNSQGRGTLTLYT
jgi:hypothetical protein